MVNLRFGSVRKRIGAVNFRLAILTLLRFTNTSTAPSFTSAGCLIRIRTPLLVAQRPVGGSSTTSGGFGNAGCAAPAGFAAPTGGGGGG